METPAGQPTEVLVPHPSEEMEIDLAGGAGLHCWLGLGDLSRGGLGSQVVRRAG
jgi:hypothetical protein